jgi:hypothetical protein
VIVTKNFELHALREAAQLPDDSLGNVVADVQVDPRRRIAGRIVPEIDVDTGYLRRLVQALHI